jgi:hypothetical protein
LSRFLAHSSSPPVKTDVLPVRQLTARILCFRGTRFAHGHDCMAGTRGADGKLTGVVCAREERFVNE